MKIKFLTIFILFAVLINLGAFCKPPDKETKKATEPFSLEYWRVFEDDDAFEEIIGAYQAAYPYVTVNYRKYRYEEYEDELLNAMAEDRGPDIFSIHNTWIEKYKNKISPMPDTVNIAQKVSVGSIKKEIVTQINTVKMPDFTDLKTDFLDVVYDDVVLDYSDPDLKDEIKRVFGLPLFVDTLALYYNRDLLNNAGITEPPEYWDEKFQEYVKKLTRQSSKGRIIQSGISFGGSENVERFSDILALLMMQNGATMISSRGYPTFHIELENSRRKNYFPGLEALRFYTDFANPGKEIYCWNSTLDNSLEAFINGRLAFMPGYAYHMPIIKSRASKLNFGITKMPQIEGNDSINFANYWVETVSRKSEHPGQAWHFIKFMTDEERVGTFLNIAKKPTARRALIEGQKEDKDLKIFADQLLTSKSWYRGYDVKSAEVAMGDMVDEMIEGISEEEEIISKGAAKVRQTIRK